MEREAFFSGYCRCQDQSRMVAAVAEDGTLAEVVCSFGSCPYEADCTVAQRIREFVKE